MFNIGSGQHINLRDIVLLLGKKYNKKNVAFIDNKSPTYLISDNKKVLKKKVKIKFLEIIKFFYN